MRLLSRSASIEAPEEKCKCPGGTSRSQHFPLLGVDRERDDISDDLTKGTKRSARIGVFQEGVEKNLCDQFAFSGCKIGCARVLDPGKYGQARRFKR